MQELKMVKVGSVSEKETRYTSPCMIFNTFRDMARLDREHFVVLHLDGKNRILAKETVSIGSLNQAIVHPREVFKAAVHNGSTSIICVHNHPTGDPLPSGEDKSITNRLYSAGEILGIKILDHIIIGEDGYFSFIESGCINNLSTTTTPQREPSKQEVFQRSTGILLRTLRKHGKMTQAKVFEITGVHQSRLSTIENGYDGLSESEAKKLAGVFDLDYTKLLFNGAAISEAAQAA